MSDLQRRAGDGIVIHGHHVENVPGPVAVWRTGGTHNASRAIYGELAHYMHETVGQFGVHWKETNTQ